MRRPILAAIAVIGVAAACSGPSEPQFTPIVVTVDWPVARERGVVDARWELIRYDDPTWGFGPVEDSGDVKRDGSVTIRFHDDCTEGRQYLTMHRIRLEGRFEGHEGSRYTRSD
jgi:hypothetical protein